MHIRLARRFHLGVVAALAFALAACSDNPAALETYLRHGFRVIGHAAKHARIDGRYVDEVLIEKFF